MDNKIQITSIYPKIRKDIEMSIDFQVEVLPLTYTREVHIREAPIIHLEFSEERHIDEILELINLLQNFLTLGVSKPVIPLMIRGRTKRQMKSEYQDTELNFEYSSNIKEFESQKIERPQMVFTFEDIKDRFDFFFNNWIEKKELLRPVYNLYFATLYNKHLYLENKFLNFVQALETYHRRVYGGKYMDNDDYEELQKNL